MRIVFAQLALLYMFSVYSQPQANLTQIGPTCLDLSELQSKLLEGGLITEEMIWGVLQQLLKGIPMSLDYGLFGKLQPG